MKNLDIIILAAGKGTRMKSPLPKVMHELGGKPLLQHVIDTAKKLSPDHIYIVLGHESETLKKHFSNDKTLKFVHQKKQLGTAHAVMQALAMIKNPQQKILILYGDVPLITDITLNQLIQKFESDQKIELGLLTANMNKPHGLGRIIRNAKNKITKIVEEKEATLKEKKITEINTGIYISTLNILSKLIKTIKANNSQGEYYLTDIVTPKINMTDIRVENYSEILGINDLEQLYQLECIYQQMLARNFRLAGIVVGQNVIFEGKIEIGFGSKIGANCILKNVSIGEHVEIKPHCVIEEAIISNHCKVGPFARIRPGTTLSNHVAIGNFTEVKNSHINQYSKIPHLSYIGDSEIGEKVNIGAGVITCNYDGMNKHKTIIGHNVFIGSDSQLIAPVEIEDGAFIGAGSTITKNAPKNKLTLSRAKQITLDHWKKPAKK
jgi:bifunctional UDP-N-acetylglucosamine pyrophosphorylase/glucosamine-1-phosphate N-acetyltransferase